VVKAYYTASLLIDVLENFVEVGVGEEFEKMRKYGRWRAAHIHTCLKSGVQPDDPPSATEEGAIHDDQEANQFLGGGASTPGMIIDDVGEEQGTSSGGAMSGGATSGGGQGQS
jgi:hypothetical protein